MLNAFNIPTRAREISLGFIDIVIYFSKQIKDSFYNNDFVYRYYPLRITIKK